MNIKFIFGVIVSLSLVISGCGGGGGSNGDKTLPQVTAPADITVEAVDAAGTTATHSTITTFLAASSAFDTVDNTNLTFAHDGPTTFPLGATVVTFSYTDTSSNTGTATATVNIIDSKAPIVTAPADLTVEASNTSTITTFLASSSAVDTIDPAPTLSHDAPSTFPLGNTIVTFSYTDASSNTGIATAIVTAIDTAAPVVTAPTSIVVEAASAAGTPISNMNISTFLSGSSAIDAIDPIPTFFHNAPTTFPLGTTVVAFTYTDASNNIGTSPATITISDTTNPVVTAPADITVEATSAAGTPASNTAITNFLAGLGAVDSVDPAPTLSHDGLTIFPLGVTVVTFTYTDASGNTGSNTATVTIVDTTAPVVTAPTDITVEAQSAAGTPASNTEITTFLVSSSAIDAVDSIPTLTHDAPVTFPLGVTIVTFIHTDATGNAGSDTATVTIVDTTAPVVTAPTDITVEAQSAAGTPASEASIVDFLAGSSATDVVDASPAFSHDAPSTFPLGTTVVTFTYTDVTGNTGIDTASVTVEDTTPPVITLLGDNPLTLLMNSTYTEPGSTVTDAVDTGLTTTVTGTVDTSDVGSFILSYDVTDTAGNVATTVTRTVNVEVVEPTNVSFTVSGKHLNFIWDSSDALDHWRILHNPDGVSGFSAIASASNIIASATGYNLEIPVHLIDWLSGQYLVEACDIGETQCKSSPNQTVALIDSIAATFYVKASNTPTTLPDLFGNTVSLSGDGNTLAVGAWREASNATGIGGNQADDTAQDSGAVYVFIKSGTTWVQQEYIKASNAEADDHFGITVSLSHDGNTLAVGANGEDSNATGIGGNQSDNTALGAGAGAVYVFSRSGSSWSQQEYIKASNTDNSDLFGKRVSISADGNTLAVGAENEYSAATGIGGNQNDNTAAQSGAVYVFTRSGATWTQQAYIKASNTETLDFFSRTIALSADGNTLAVGAEQEDSAATGIDGDQTDNTANVAGAVYVFTRSGTTWTQQDYIKASNTESPDNFGSAVALSTDGSTLAVGADGERSDANGIDGNQSDNTAVDSGAVYVFTRSGTTWTQEAYIKASNSSVQYWFGGGAQGSTNTGRTVSLSSDGNILAIGSNGEDGGATGIGGDQADTSGANYAGAVYVFKRTGTTWIQKAYVKASNTDPGDLFGGAVSLSADGNTMAIGAESEKSTATGIGGDNTNTTANSAGAVYVY
jgi:trimeric autotransporter adhesin